MQPIRKYISIPKPLIHSFLTQTKKFRAAHLYLIHGTNMILAHHRQLNIISSFGGYSEPNETLIETTTREFSEESLGCIMPSNQLVDRLHNIDKLVCHTDNQHRYYSMFCDISDMQFNIEAINWLYNYTIDEHQLMSHQLEYDGIVSVPIREIERAISNGTCIPNNYIIREQNVDVYRWFLSQNPKC